MGDVTIKSTGALIDELCTVSMKIFWGLEKAEQARIEGDTVLVGVLYGNVQVLNSKRSKLIRAIDKRLGEEDLSPDIKTF